jgi:endonuclease/exonuclease/phosphatase family metal-dependent hydrolase
MTFNVRYAEAEDGPNRWDRRKALAVERIRAFAPDLLGVQECSVGAQAAYLRRCLRGWDFHGVPTDDADWPGEMAPVLVRRRAFETIAAGHFWLSETPEVASKSWGAAFARTATWAELRHVETGRTLVFLNTHVDYRREARTKSAQLLARWVARARRRLPVIVAGDFNAGKRSAAYRHLTRRGVLRDVFREPGVSSADDGSFHGFGTVDPPAAIDWILVGGPFVVDTAVVDRTCQAGRATSDHYPVTATVEWE